MKHGCYKKSVLNTERGLLSEVVKDKSYMTDNRILQNGLKITPLKEKKPLAHRELLS